MGNHLGKGGMGWKGAGLSGVRERWGAKKTRRFAGSQLVEKVMWCQIPLRLTSFGTSPKGRGFDKKSFLM